MILADTSAWVEWLRGTGSVVDARMHTLIVGSSELTVTDVVLMELLAGASDEARRRRLRRLLARFGFAGTHGPRDYEDAAQLYRTCRRAGDTPRSQLDCLIAAVAIRNDAALLHADADFEALARHTPLRIATGR